MKVTLASPKRYLLFYLFFSFLFISALIGLIRLGNFPKRHSVQSVQNPSDSPANPVVVIDAGHGGEDGGAVGTTGIYEKTVNLQIATMLCDLLHSNGIETVMTRTEDILLYDKNSDYHGQKKIQDLSNRRKIAEQYENAVFISIHMNSFPQAQYQGLQVYYSQNNPKSQHLAQMIQISVQQAIQPENGRKVKAADSNIYLLDRLTCPSVLVECGFLSNPQECALLSSKEYQKKLSLLLCRSVLEFLSVSESNLDGKT